MSVCDGKHIAQPENRLVTSAAKRQSSILKNSWPVFKQAALSALLCRCQSASSHPAQLMWDNKHRQPKGTYFPSTSLQQVSCLTCDSVDALDASTSRHLTSTRKPLFFCCCWMFQDAFIVTGHFHHVTMSSCSLDATKQTECMFFWGLFNVLESNCRAPQLFCHRALTNNQTARTELNFGRETLWHFGPTRPKRERVFWWNLPLFKY